VDGAVHPIILLLLPCSGRTTFSLHSQIAALRNLRRPRNAFREWKPEIFYYLFVLVGAFWISWLTCARWSSLRGMATTGFCFGILCCLPRFTNQFRLQLLFRWPNKLLERKIASLQVEVELQKELGPRAELDNLPKALPPCHLSPSSFPDPLAQSPNLKEEVNGNERQHASRTEQTTNATRSHF
jgi:hypothetical protein